MRAGAKKIGHIDNVGMQARAGPVTLKPESHRDHGRALHAQRAGHSRTGELGGPGTVYVNSCSFPSGEFNSNPFDCLAIPDGGFLTVQKVATPNDPAVGFSFSISDTLTTLFSPTIYGSGTSPRSSASSWAATPWKRLSHPAWQLASASCVDQYGQPAGTGANPISG